MVFTIAAGSLFHSSCVVIYFDFEKFIDFLGGNKTFVLNQMID